MNKMQKFLEIKQEIDKDLYFSMKRKRKKLLFKELNKIKPLPIYFYSLSFGVLLVLGYFCLLPYYSYLIKKEIFIKGINYLFIFLIIIIILIVFLVIRLINDLKFKKNHKIDLNTYKNKIINNINKEDEAFYQILKDISEKNIESLGKELKSLGLKDDMVKFFKKDLKEFIFLFKFDDVIVDNGLNDEGHSSTRHALLEGSN